MDSPGCDRSGRTVVAHAPTAPLIVEAQWSDSLEAELSHEEARNLKPWARRQVLDGTAQVWICDDGLDRLIVITRLELEPVEWCIVYVQGSGVMKFGPEFVALARRKGWPLRMHTTSAATARLCARLGFRLREYVLRLE